MFTNNVISNVSGWSTCQNTGEEVKHILIPDFIKTAFAARQLLISDILDFNKIIRVLSANDIAILIAIQKGWCQIFSGLQSVQAKQLISITQDRLSSSTLTARWFTSSSIENRSTLSVIEALAQDEALYGKVSSQYFNKDDSSTETAHKGDGYEIIELDRKIVGIIVETGFFPDPSTAKKFLRDLIQQQYMYASHDEVARHALFELYVASLR